MADKLYKKKLFFRFVRREFFIFFLFVCLFGSFFRSSFWTSLEFYIKYRFKIRTTIDFSVLAHTISSEACLRIFPKTYVIVLWSAKTIFIHGFSSHSYHALNRWMLIHFTFYYFIFISSSVTCSWMMRRKRNEHVSYTRLYINMNTVVVNRTQQIYVLHVRRIVIVASLLRRKCTFSFSDKHLPYSVYYSAACCSHYHCLWFGGLFALTFLSSKQNQIICSTIRYIEAFGSFVWILFIYFFWGKMCCCVFSDAIVVVVATIAIQRFLTFHNIFNINWLQSFQCVRVKRLSCWLLLMFETFTKAYYTVAQRHYVCMQQRVKWTRCEIKYYKLLTIVYCMYVAYFIVDFGNSRSGSPTGSSLMLFVLFFLLVPRPQIQKNAMCVCIAISECLCPRRGFRLGYFINWNSNSTLTLDEAKTKKKR